jgi:hypothetical protein
MHHQNENTFEDNPIILFLTHLGLIATHKKNKPYAACLIAAATKNKEKKCKTSCCLL